MAYVSVSEWRPEQVTEWLKGLDVCVTPYLHWFSNNEVSGQRLLNLSPDDLTHLGVHKIGHQELILQAVEHLRNFHYELDRENLQLLALRVSCAAHSLFNEIKHKEETTYVPTQTMADVCNVINHVKPLVSWLDRPPFSGQIEYADFKSQLLRISLEMATCAQRDTFAEKPISEIRNCSSKLFKLADSIMQDIKDPMLLQPASLDLATIKKRVGEDIGFFLIPSFHGVHQISEMKLSSPAHQSGKLQTGDEVVQVNYQTVVGWSRKTVLALFDESPNDLLLTLKRRPRHVKMYGQIYMKPYRLPSRKRASPYSRWNDKVSSPRTELLILPPFQIPRVASNIEKTKNMETALYEPSGTSSSSDEEYGSLPDSRNSVTLSLLIQKPRAHIQRRFTLSGPPRPSAQSEQFWRELQLERSWRSNQNNSNISNSNSEEMRTDEGSRNDIFHLRDKSASLGNSIAAAPLQPSTGINFVKTKIGNVQFDLSQTELPLQDLDYCYKVPAEDENKTININTTRDKKNSGQSVDVDNNNLVNYNNKLSISKLNKIKRDAFFNDMGYQGTRVSGCSVEDSSEKVRRVIENFKSEVSNIKMEISDPDILFLPGKVSLLIGNFEKKDIANTQKFRPVKNELNISSKNSTYKNCDGSPSAIEKTEMNFKETEKISPVGKKYLMDDKSDVQNSELTILMESSDSEINFAQYQEIHCDQESHGPMIQTINDNLLDTNFYGPKSVVRNKNAQIDKDKDSVCRELDLKFNCEVEAEVNGNEELAFLELKNRQSPCDSKELQKKNVVKDVLMEVIPSTCPSAASDENYSEVSGCVKGEYSTKGVDELISKNQTEKSYLNLKNSRISPLPPKPGQGICEDRGQFCFTKSSVKTKVPPEPPPRSEISLLKSHNSRTNELVSIDRECEHTSSGGDMLIENISNLILSHTNSSASVSSSRPRTDPDRKGYEKRQGSHEDVSARHTFKHDSSSRTINTTSEKWKSSGSTFENFKAILNLGKKPLSFSSPRSARKKNVLLARRRNVSVKEVMPCQNSGFLWYRNRRGTAYASWSKFFFVLQGSNFYGFKARDSHKAEIFIHLPGSTCTPADEVKSKDFAFKIYHTGTAFYFAANSEEDLHQWLDGVSQATLCTNDKKIPETVIFSVSDSDSDSDADLEPETCFPTSPKMKKFLGSSPAPKPARSHQNLASDSKKAYETPKKFGSLKKLTSQKYSTSCNNSEITESCGTCAADVTSLDRKYLRFLGQKNTPIPVPTSQFRSYRRMQPSSTSAPHGKLEEKNETGKNLSLSTRYQQGLVRKALHLSNPSLIHPDMADYRITQERLAEFRRLRSNEPNPDPIGVVPLEQRLLLSRPEDELLLRSNRPKHNEIRGLITLEQFLLRQEEENSLVVRPNRIQDIPLMCQTSEEQIGLNQEGRKFSPTVSWPFKENTPQSAVCKCKKSGENSQCSQSIGNDAMQHVRKTKDSKKCCNECKGIEDVKSTCPCSDSTSELSAFSEDNTLRNSLKEDVKTSCSHLSKDPTPHYSGLEYPPAFEPETYTIQCMLKNRRKRTAVKNDGEV